MRQDEYTRKTDGYLPTAEVAFIDEIFKANSAILNALLTLLNERLFDNGNKRLEVPLLCLVSCPLRSLGFALFMCLLTFLCIVDCSLDSTPQCFAHAAQQTLVCDGHQHPGKPLLCLVASKCAEQMPYSQLMAVTRYHLLATTLVTAVMCCERMPACYCTVLLMASALRSWLLVTSLCRLGTIATQGLAHL